MLSSNTFQKIQFYWIFSSVIIFFAGAILSSLNEHSSLGQFLSIIGIISIILYFLISILQWFKFKKGEGLKNLLTAYIFLSVLMIISGLIGAFLTFPDGMTIFIYGVIMLGIFWIGKLIQFIFMKEEDFK